MASAEEGASRGTARQGTRRPSAGSAFRRGAPNSTNALLVLRGTDSFPVEEELAALGYDIVATARRPEQALDLTGDLRPDAVIVLLDSLERASALLAVRMLSHRYACAVVVLAEQLDRATQAQLKLVTPHAVAPLPIATEILDVVIHAALDSAVQRTQARLARDSLAAGPPRLAATGLDPYLHLAVGRAVRNASTFAAGVVDFVLDEVHGTPPGELTSDAAQRLKSQLRQQDLVQHRGDGTLVFIAEDVGHEELEPLGARILHALSRSPRNQDRPAAWPAIGLALWSAPGQDPHSVVAEAEEAMAQAKAAGGASWRISGSDRSAKPVAGTGRERRTQMLDAVTRSPLPLVFLQRSIGWVSLGVLVWIAANYAGFGTADKLASQTDRLITFFRSLW